MSDQSTRFYNEGSSANYSVHDQSAMAGNAAKTKVLGGQGPVSLAFVVIVEGDQPGRIFQLHPSEPTTIGREFNCEIMLNDPSISRQNAKIKVEMDDKKRLNYRIFDLASENGTQVNDEPAAGALLKDGDRIKVGNAILVFKQV